MSHFTRKFNQLIDGNLQQCEIEDNEKFQDYLQRIIDDNLEENESNPIKYFRNEFYELSLEMTTKIAFATADNPFLKSHIAKYYPEVVVVD